MNFEIQADAPNTIVFYKYTHPHTRIHERAHIYNRRLDPLINFPEPTTYRTPESRETYYNRHRAILLFIVLLPPTISADRHRRRHTTPVKRTGIVSINFDRPLRRAGDRKIPRTRKNK